MFSRPEIDQNVVPTAWSGGGVTFSTSPFPPLVLLALESGSLVLLCSTMHLGTVGVFSFLH